MAATVLVVDDLLPNVKLLEAKLTSEYYEVLTARSGAEALKVVSENSVDIILLDVMMPEMDGFETCRRLKSDIKTSHIPIVMVTALSDVEDRIQGLEAGADDFLTKPINDMALFARIKSLVRMKIMLDELRLRDQTGSQFGGLLNDPNDPNDKFKIIEGAQILIVDDDGAQAKHIANKLKTIKNAITDIVVDPTLAFDKVINGTYDLIIISTLLTDADGLRLCSHIKGHEKVRHVPILILVEESDTRILIKGLDLGVNDYLITPIESNEVLARVNTQVRRKRFQDALKSNYQQSVSLAVTDGLTGLYNRRYFDAHCKNLMEQAVIQNKPILLLITDIDHFKMVNDTYGHVVGDEILKQVAERLSASVRITDLVARFGGEEFVVVMPNTDIDIGREIAERIRGNIQNTPFKVSSGDGTLLKTTSIGITQLKPGDDIESILKRADKGLYSAKENGRNQVVVVE
jgi:two-component system cell cycle response regulator